MEKRFLSLLVLYFCTLFALPCAWINELHYDNAGIDRHEFVEVVVEHPETCYLGDLALYMYNGYDGRPYCLDTIDEFVPGDSNDVYHIYTWYQTGIQNDMEGMVLVYRDTILDILAYEGEFTGARVPADGEVFPDIGVYETGSGADTCSLYLTGMPGSDWTYGSATPGSLNTGQSFPDTPQPVLLRDFNAVWSDDQVCLDWSTASETDVSAFNLYRNDILITCQEARGSSSAGYDYVFSDIDIPWGTDLVYVLSELTLAMTEVFLDTLHLACVTDECLRIGDLYPNPANPSCTLPMETRECMSLTVSLYAVSGRKIADLFNGSLPPGRHNVSLKLKDYASGAYFVRCLAERSSRTLALTIVK